MSRLRVYMKTFGSDGEYLPDYREITEDISATSMGDIRQILDDNVYDVGVFKVSDFQLTLRNENGLYSEPGSLRTLFRYKRADTLIKIVWQIDNVESICGIWPCGGFVAGNEQIEIYEGLLNDDSAETEIREQKAEFKVLGKESLFARVEAPYSSFAPGDLASLIMFRCLNQSPIVDLLGVGSDNIDPALDFTIDDVTGWENSTVREVMSDLLTLTNSVLYIRDGSIYIKSRDEGASVSATFYGQGSNTGIENIMGITNIRTGINKMFNYWTWKDTSLRARDLDSIDRNGIKKKEIEYDEVTDSTKRQNILNELRNEFGQEKMSLNIVVPMTIDFLDLYLLDKVTIDYPTVFYVAEGEVFPIYGVSRYGEAVYPFGEWSLTLDTNTEWKIMGRSLKLKNQQIEFQLKEV